MMPMRSNEQVRIGIMQGGLHYDWVALEQRSRPAASGG